MIRWANPQCFWLFAALPMAAAFIWFCSRRRASALAAFAAAALLPRLAPGVDRRRRMLREGLRLGGLALLVAALAGPEWGLHWEEVRREGLDVIIALDTSRSMLATDLKPNRIDRAKLAIRELLTELHGDRIGLVAFAGTAFLECPLTLDYAAFAQSLDATDVGIIPRGGTALAEAITTGIEAFEARQGKHEALILITDGENHEGDVEDAATRAAERGIKVFTVGVGTSEGDLIPLGGAGDSGYVKDTKGHVVKSRLNEDTLRQIAATTAGAYVHSGEASLGLDEIFRDHISTMEKRELQSTVQRRYDARFQIPLAVAIALLLIEPAVGERRTPRTDRRRRGAAS